MPRFQGIMLHVRGAHPGQLLRGCCLHWNVRKFSTEYSDSDHFQQHWTYNHHMKKLRVSG